MKDDHAYSEPWHSQSRLFKHFQGYVGIFNDIDVYSATLRGAQLEGEGKSTLSFLKFGNSALILERKALIVSIFELNFIFKMSF